MKKYCLLLCGSLLSACSSSNMTSQIINEENVIIQVCSLKENNKLTIVSNQKTYPQGLDIVHTQEFSSLGSQQPLLTQTLLEGYSVAPEQLKNIIISIPNPSTHDRTDYVYSIAHDLNSQWSTWNSPLFKINANDDALIEYPSHWAIQLPVNEKAPKVRYKIMPLGQYMTFSQQHKYQFDPYEQCF